MAENNNPNQKKTNDQKLEELANKSELAVFGVGTTLGKESEQIKEIIKQTMMATSEKYGNRANGRVVNYFNELNFSTAFSELMKEKGEDKKAGGNAVNADKKFKEYMSNQDIANMSAVLMAESGRLIAYSNYKAIYNHIPEAAQALDTYKDNIMSPDDFTKLIFNISYDNELDAKLRDRVEKQLKDIAEKYEVDELADEIIEGALLYGDQYVTILSLESEFDRLLSDPGFAGATSLNEQTMKTFDTSVVDIEVNKKDVEKSQSLTEAFSEVLQVKPEDKAKLNEDITTEIIAQLINKNVKIGSKKEFILERAAAEQEKLSTSKDVDVPQLKAPKSNKGKKGGKDDKPLYVNGSTMKLLDPSKMVELKIDNVVYGYYYVEGSSVGDIPNAGYLGQSTGREVLNPVTMGSNIITTNNSKFTVSTNNLSTVGMSDSKVNVISRVFLNVLSKKINKDFVRHNKEFKDFIYNLVKQDYILKKEVKLTYFAPNEVIAFKVPALYRKIVFFAKLYLAMLTNILLIKMGRAHDKRVFYVDVGADANYEQAISRVIQDIKTKEFKMDAIGDINTILNLNPGRFDDYYIPTVNGERPIEIETIQGMDVDMTNDFLEFLKDSMMSGIGVPRNLIEASKELDFARTLTAQNANFVRNVIKYQKKLTMPFTKMFRLLYENEYKFNNDQESNILSLVAMKDIHVTFPSPATLNMSNLTDQIQTVQSNAEFIASTLIIEDPTGLNDEPRKRLRSEIIRDLLPGIDWEKYDTIKDRIELENAKAKSKKKNTPPEPGEGAV